MVSSTLPFIGHINENSLRIRQLWLLYVLQFRYRPLTGIDILLFTIENESPKQEIHYRTLSFVRKRNERSHGSHNLFKFSTKMRRHSSWHFSRTNLSTCSKIYCGGSDTRKRIHFLSNYREVSSETGTWSSKSFSKTLL